MIRCFFFFLLFLVHLPAVRASFFGGGGAATKLAHHHREPPSTAVCKLKALAKPISSNIEQTSLSRRAAFRHRLEQRPPTRRCRLRGV